MLRNARGGGWVYAQALRSVTRGWGGVRQRYVTPFFSLYIMYRLYVNDTSSKYGDHNLSIRPSISAIDRSSDYMSECVIYATMDFQETAFAANY